MNYELKDSEPKASYYDATKLYWFLAEQARNKIFDFEVSLRQACEVVGHLEYAQEHTSKLIEVVIKPLLGVILKEACHKANCMVAGKHEDSIRFLLNEGDWVHHTKESNSDHATKNKLYGEIL